MISEFLSVLKTRSLAHASRYQVEFLQIPSGVSAGEGVSEFQRDLKFFCSAVEVPGTQILTLENRIYDLPQKFAYMKAHDEITLTLRVDRDYNSKKFFDAWVNSVYNRDTGDVYYKSSYVGSLQIQAMTVAGKCPYGINLIDCFPTQVGNLSYGWENSQTILQFTVSLAFTKEITVVGLPDLFTPKDSTASKGNVLGSNSDTSGLSFDNQDLESIATYKDNVYSAVNNSFIENAKQKMTMGVTNLDTSILKKYF